jgi:predicted enzyme related to lactoylglutathione lyase
MQRVTGLGGIFFKARDPQKLYRWYERHLGLKRDPSGAPVCFFWREARGRGKGMTVWSLFPRNTRYFRPGRASFMLNYRVKHLDALLKALRREDVWIDPKREGTTDYGRFAWIQDPEGNRIELWQPPAEKRTTRRRKPTRKSRQTKRARAR